MVPIKMQWGGFQEKTKTLEDVTIWGFPFLLTSELRLLDLGEVSADSF